MSKCDLSGPSTSPPYRLLSYHPKSLPLPETMLLSDHLFPCSWKLTSGICHLAAERFCLISHDTPVHLVRTTQYYRTHHPILQSIHWLPIKQTISKPSITRSPPTSLSSFSPTPPPMPSDVCLFALLPRTFCPGTGVSFLLLPPPYQLSAL